MRKRKWAFLTTDGAVVCPTQITNGTVSIVQFTDTVTLDASASAVVQDQITGPPTAEPGILYLQIRFGNSPTNGQIYSIVAVDNTTPTAVVLTLDRIVQEVTNTTSAYQIY